MAKKYYILIFLSYLFCLAAAQKKSGSSGKEIFENKCARCHGDDGTKGRWGAKNLQKSRLDNEELIRIVSKGKNLMPSWEKRLSKEELNNVSGYVKGLRK